MSTARWPAVAPLVEGQSLDRVTFHERYLASRPDFRAELIDGVVVMPSPVSDRHSDFVTLSVLWLGTYAVRTSGVKAGTEASTALDEHSEVQPDALLRIKPESGGQTRKLANIIAGSPELIIEVASTSKAIDLGPKLADYERAGALEYLVFTIDPDEVYWHLRQEGRLVRVAPNPDGLYRSQTFPGLWLDPVAFLDDDGPAILGALERGLATEEHAAFVRRLAARQAKVDP